MEGGGCWCSGRPRAMLGLSRHALYSPGKGAMDTDPLVGGVGVGRKGPFLQNTEGAIKSPPAGCHFRSRISSSNDGL